MPEALLREVPAVEAFWSLWDKMRTNARVRRRIQEKAAADLDGSMKRPRKTRFWSFS